MTIDDATIVRRHRVVVEATTTVAGGSVSASVRLATSAKHVAALHETLRVSHRHLALPAGHGRSSGVSSTRHAPLGARTGFNEAGLQLIEDAKRW